MPNGLRQGKEVIFYWAEGYIPALWDPTELVPSPRIRWSWKINSRNQPSVGGMATRKREEVVNAGNRVGQAERRAKEEGATPQIRQRERRRCP